MRTLTKLSAIGLLAAPLLGCNVLEQRPTMTAGRPVPITVTVVTREPEPVRLVKPTAATIRALLGDERDVSCCTPEICWASESHYTCCWELIGEGCENAACMHKGCICTDPV